MANYFNSDRLQQFALALSAGSQDPSLFGNLLNMKMMREDRDKKERKEFAQETAASTLLANMGQQGTPEYKKIRGLDDAKGEGTLGIAAPATNLLNSSTQDSLMAKAVGPQNYLMSKLASARPDYKSIDSIGLVDVNAAGGPKTVIPVPQKDPNALTEWQRTQIQNQDRRLDQQDAAQRAAEARAAAADAARNRPQATPYVNRNTGNPIRHDPVTGSYMDEDKAITANDLIPAADFNKDVEAARVVVGDLANAASVEALIKSNPGAFKEAKVNEARLKRKIPFKGEQMANDVFTPEENAVRARVAQDSAVILNKLYGAALSAGENVRAASFAPNPDDTLEQLLPKVEAAKAWANSKKTSLIPGAIKAAERQLNAPQQQAPQGDTITSPDQAQLPPGMVRQVGTYKGKPVYVDGQGQRHVAG